jgi:BolA family transcriptional regulator, general stress-responsive regulator
MRMAEIIRRKLETAFEPERLLIEDESHQHAGHAGSRPGGETHFRVILVSPVFIGVSRVERQRRVYEVLADEMRDRVHALALSVKTPDEVN